MGRKLNILYMIFSLALFITLAGLFCFRILETRKDNIRRSADGFELILPSVESAYRRGKGFDTEEFKSVVERIFSAERNLRVLSVYSFDIGVQYIRARTAEDLSLSQATPYTDRSPPQTDSGGFTRAKISLPMGPQDGRTFLVEGVYRVLDQEDFYPPLRDTVLILVVFSVLTSIFTILLRLFGAEDPDPRGARRERSEKRLSVPAPPEENPLQFQPYSPPDPAKADSACGPTASGLGRQEDLEKRLSLEQERSAFNEQDISLALLRFPGLSRSQNDYLFIAKEIQGRIAFEDLVFEFEDDGYAVILPNSNLDESMATVSHFLKTLKEDLAQRHPQPRCGLTSRNGRIVDGERLLAEGRKALAKTGAAEPDNIIGFRPDPGKYREFLSKQGPP